MEPFPYQPSLSFAKEMDSADPLKSFREKFHFPKKANGEDCIYLCGNSLGLQPKSTRAYIEQELKDWETLGVEAHFHAKNPWMPYHEFLAERMAAITGAKPMEVVVMNSLTVNLHLMMVSFYRPSGKRNKIVIEAGAFPSDQYAVKSQIQYHGFDPETSLVELTPRAGEHTLRAEDVEEVIRRQGESIALIMLGGVNYYTGQEYDMKRITQAGHSAGCVVGFDLAHAVGNISLSLHDWNVDFAVWCTYKYLNAGPGSVGGCFVHEKHSRRFDLPRFAGWWGHDKQTRFLMPSQFNPIAGAEGWQLSNAPVFSMAALRASLELFEQAGTGALREKSILLTGYLQYLLDGLESERISVITPRSRAERGCQLSIRVKHADKNLFEKISLRGVVADWREPDVIRVAPVPLYNNFTDVYFFIEILKELLQ